LKAFRASYFMISVDSLEDNTAFAEKENANFPILADPTKDTANTYGVIGRFDVANRWTFFIGPDGRILDIEKQVSPQTAGEDAVAKLKTLGAPMR
jgi:peroxiredoxin Q/BCP